MAQETGQITPVETAEPTAAQVARARALRRFNLFFVYTPIALAALTGAALLGLLLWSAIAGGWFGAVDVAGGRSLASGLADTIFLLGALPCALLCPAVPALLLAGLLAGRKQGMAPLSRLQSALRRLDNLIVKGDEQVNRLAPRVANLAVAPSAQVARLKTIGRKFLRRTDAGSH